MPPILILGPLQKPSFAIVVAETDFVILVVLILLKRWISPIFQIVVVLRNILISIDLLLTLGVDAKQELLVVLNFNIVVLVGLQSLETFLGILTLQF